jgi:cell division protein DivIC
VETTLLDHSAFAERSYRTLLAKRVTETNLAFFSKAILKRVRRFTIMQTNAALRTSTRSNKGSSRRLRLLMVFLLCFMSWAGVTIWDQFSKLHSKSVAFKELQAQQSAVLKQNEDTKREIARLNDNEYIEQIIRKDLHYIKPGETIFFTPKTTP